MKESLWGYWILVLGIGTLSVMILLQNFTTTSEQDYYLLKNVLEASMNESIDYGYYRETGNLRMNTEKFVENFYRRFAETASANKTYEVNIYQVYEMPPAASVSVTTKTNQTNFGLSQSGGEQVDVTNSLTGIIFTDKGYQPNN